MKAGDLNKVITFRNKSIAYNGYNEPIETWADAASVWAKIVNTGGKEFYAAQKKNAETEAVFKVRYTKRVNERMQIKYGNRTYEILSINDVGENHVELQISAKEVK